MHRACGDIRRARALSFAGRDGTGALRRRRVQVFRLAAAAAGRRATGSDSTRISRGPPTDGAMRWAATNCIRRTSNALLQICRRAGQTKPTPLLLRYDAGGYNCLHQDLYGEVAFPLQLTCLLSRTGVDFSGGEFLLVENRPRVQSRGEAVVLEQGEAIIFATQRAAGRRQPRPLPGNDAPRGEPGAPRPPLQPGDHFSRREITAAAQSCKSAETTKQRLPRRAPPR